MSCKLCGSDRVRIIYNDVIRNGGIGKYTKDPVPMYQCEECGVIWHDPIVADIGEYYESTEYRALMDEGSEAETFYKNYDKQTLDKFTYTGTDIFRGRVVADVGCGAGAFLDFLKGVASEIIAIEPSEPYRKILREKGFSTYAYTEDAVQERRGEADVITSFDVIEHVEDPQAFLQSSYDLLAPGGYWSPVHPPMHRSCEACWGRSMKRECCSVYSIYGYSAEKAFAGWRKR